MDIKYLINGLLDFNSAYDVVCKDNVELVTENKALKETIEFITKNSKRSPFNNVEKVALKNGENELFEYVSYQTWLKDKVCKDNLPATVSFNDFVTHFNKKLYKMYEEEKAKGIEELKKNMKKVEEAKENE